MKKKEMVEMTITYCDWCKEKISDSSYTSVRKEDGTELDFHSYDKKCIVLYTQSEITKRQEEKRRKKNERRKIK